MKYPMFYEMAADGLPKAQANFPAHQARLKEFHQKGTLPVGALGIFTSRAAAEEFVAGDPFVINGVVGKHSIQEWREALAP